MIKFKKKSRWTPAPEGIHNAVVVDVVGDREGVEKNAPACDSVRIVWEIETLQSNGHPFTVTKIYQTNDEFMRDFDPVLGSDHPLLSGDTEDVQIVIGVPVRVDLVHNAKKNGETFAHVRHKLPAGRVLLKPSAGYTRLKDRYGTVQPLPQPERATAATESEVSSEAA